MRQFLVWKVNFVISETGDVLCLCPFFFSFCQKLSAFCIELIYCFILTFLEVQLVVISSNEIVVLEPISTLHAFFLSFSSAAPSTIAVLCVKKHRLLHRVTIARQWVPIQWNCIAILLVSVLHAHNSVVIASVFCHQLSEIAVGVLVYFFFVHDCIPLWNTEDCT